MSADDGWAAGNRIMCDFVHRAIVPKRLAVDDRDPVLEDLELVTAT
jgi:hypothetical protein